jgi:hypothetical protein
LLLQQAVSLASAAPSDRSAKIATSLQANLKINELHAPTRLAQLRVRVWTVNSLKLEGLSVLRGHLILRVVIPDFALLAAQLFGRMAEGEVERDVGLCCQAMALESEVVPNIQGNVCAKKFRFTGEHHARPDGVPKIFLDQSNHFFST